MVQTKDGVRYFFSSSRVQPSEISFQLSKLAFQPFRTHTHTHKGESQIYAKIEVLGSFSFSFFFFDK